MATLIFFDDFQSYPIGVNTITAPWVNTGPLDGPDSEISGTVYHSPDRSLGIGVHGGSALGGGWVQRDFMAALNQVTADFWIYMPSGSDVPDPPEINAPGVQLINGVMGSGDLSDALSFIIGGAGTVNIGHNGGTPWFTFSLTLDTWHHVRWATTLATSGSSSVVVDGGAPMTFSGNTKTTGSSTTVNYVNLQGQFVAGDPPIEIFFDDFAIYNGIYVPSNPPEPILCGPLHSSTQINPIWSNTSDAPYELQYRVNGTSAWTQINGIPGTSFVITGLLPSTEYEWQVSGATSGFGDSGFCFTDAAQVTFLSCQHGWTVTQPVTKIWGFDHLIGIAVVGLLDGIPMAPQIVAADGSVTLPFPASNVKIGLPFTPQLQTVRLDAGSPTVQGRRKAVSALTARVNRSGPVQLGTNQIDGSTTSPQSLAPAWTKMTTAPLQPQQGTQGPSTLTYLSPSGQTVTLLQTGDIRTTVNDTWAKPGQLALQQTLPLPLEVLSVMPELLEGDITEQGFAQEQKPQQHPDQRRQHQGPGAWMLRR